MQTKNLKKTAFLAILMCVILIASLGTATYAWFTYNSNVNTNRITAKVSDAGVELLIANDENGPFDVTTELILTNDTDVLTPVTTSNLSDFFIAAGHDAAGIVRNYRSINSADVDKYLIHGTVYLKSVDSPCDVYFDPAFIDFGEDIQALASMRAGFIFGGSKGGTFIFRMDGLQDLSSAQRKVTITTDGMVYSGSGLVDDPAVDFASYFGTSGEETATAGETPLAHIEANEVIPVEYYVWFEGCDINCFNAVQGRDMALQLGFIGV